MTEPEQSHEEMIERIISLHFKQSPQTIDRITIGICNEVYRVGLHGKDVIVRLSPTNKFLMGSHDHIPKFKTLGIPVPDILAEDYSRTTTPLCYQIQSKIEGQDLGGVIDQLNAKQLNTLAKEIVSIFKKVKTLPTSNLFGVVWGGDNDLSDSWTQRMKIWVEESIERGTKTGVMDDQIASLAISLYEQYKSYFDTVKPVMYYGDICSKNVMILNGAFNGLVDLDGLTQGDPLEAIGRIRLSWYGSPYGEIYSQAIMSGLNLNEQERKIVTLYALINKISWTCENGVQFNQNTKAIVDKEKANLDRVMIKKIAEEL